jgi:hypothetical protein
MTIETTAPVAETQTAPVTAPVEQSLEDVYKEVGVVVAQPQVQQQVAPVIPKTVVPDPYEEGFKTFQEKQDARLAAIETHQQTQLKSQFEKQQAERNAKLVEDIKVASSFVVDNTGLKDLPYSDEVKMKMAKMELNERAGSDPKFKYLWDNKDTNPEAWGKAAKAFSKELASKYNAVVDPKLAADRRALRASTGSSATTDVDVSGNPLEGLSGAEFDRAWARIARGNRN